MPFSHWVSILILWIAAGFLGALFFFAYGFRFEPRDSLAREQEEESEGETASERETA